MMQEGTQLSGIQEAKLWRKLNSGQIQCLACQHFCRLSATEWGKCAVRGHEDSQPSRLISRTRRSVVAANIDPVEKKPLYHYLAGSTTFSLGTVGCNFHCQWCQNSSIACDFQRQPPQEYVVDPAYLVKSAQESQCKSLAFTYTEPTVFLELMEDCANLAQEAGLGRILVSNGFQSPQSLKSLQGCIDAANIDLKTFQDKNYRSFCGARLQPVLRNLVKMREMGWWLEVTTLVIPGINDSPTELQAIARFIVQELGREVPWHLSAFTPRHHMGHLPPTPEKTLQDAAAMARSEGLFFPYIGNSRHSLPTFCPSCQQPVIDRLGFSIQNHLTKKAQCPHCKKHVPGFWA